MWGGGGGGVHCLRWYQRERREINIYTCREKGYEVVVHSRQQHP